MTKSMSSYNKSVNFIFLFQLTPLWVNHLFDKMQRLFAQRNSQTTLNNRQYLSLNCVSTIRLCEYLYISWGKTQGM